jgi:hypothetical protein
MAALCGLFYEYENMATSKSVQFTFNGNTNAPQLISSQGALVALLDAVLVNGYGSQAVTTLVANNEGVITASFNLTHNFKPGQILMIQGGSDSAFNGRFRVDTTQSNSLTFAEKLPGAKAASGTITAKVAPLGYEIAFTDGAFKRAYKSLNPENAMYYIFDDNLWSGWSASYAKICNVGIAFEMTDINTIVGLQCPYNAANPNQNWQLTGSGSAAVPGWAKVVYGCWAQGVSTYLSSGSAGNHTWSIIGNDEGFYLCAASAPAGANSNKSAVCQYFGKYQSFTENSFNYLLCGNLKRSAAGNYQDINSTFLYPGGLLDDFRSDCKLLADSTGVGISTGITPLLPYAGQHPTGSGMSPVHIFDDTTGVSLLRIPFARQSDGVVEGELPFVHIALQARRPVSNGMGVYTQQVFRHSNGNHFVEINSLIGANTNISSFFFELKD